MLGSVIRIPPGVASAESIVWGIWTSAREGGVGANDVANDATGYLAELERVGTAQAEPGAPYGSGFTSRLRPVTNLDRLIQAGNRDVIFLGGRWDAYDTTRDPVAPGPQDQAVLNAITGSADPSDPEYSVSQQYVQSRFRNSVVGGWQPNWFRPSIYVDGRAVIYTGLDLTYHAPPRHLGDLSIGLPIPHCLEAEFHLGSFREISVFAQAIQHVYGVANPFQRYVLQWTAVFQILNDPV